MFSLQPYMNETRKCKFSPDRKYRYTLEITWDASLPRLAVVGLNPSTADETQDDPTVRRCKNLAKDLGKGGLLMLNAFAYRSTDPRGMLAVSDPTGELNQIFDLDGYIKESNCDIVVVAWGTNMKRYPARNYILSQWKRPLFCLKKTKEGYPQHPLYLPNGLKPIPFN